eukprot:3116718-Pleurochrysis_carterae.AAC.1
MPACDAQAKKSAHTGASVHAWLVRSCARVHAHDCAPPDAHASFIACANCSVRTGLNADPGRKRSVRLFTAEKDPAFSAREVTPVSRLRCLPALVPYVLDRLHR